jgi:hypothetical protein
MSDVMSFAEVGDQLVELLPARTVLSLPHATDVGVIGTPGASGTHGANGPGLVESTWSGLASNNDPSNAPRLIVGITEPSGRTS